MRSYGPGGGLTFNAKGDLLGTASFGRRTASVDGTVFELTPNAGGRLTFQTIHGFSQATGDGANPGSAVVFDSKGNLYGPPRTAAPGAALFMNCRPPPPQVESGRRPSCTSSTRRALESGNLPGTMDVILVAV